MSAMLASDAVENKIRFPAAVQPKIDGVRGLNETGQMTARSLKKHKNKFTASYFSAPEFKGIDGELAAEYETHPDLCRLTTSATSTITGEPYLLWHGFDFITPETRLLPYLQRYEALKLYLTLMWSRGLCERVRLVPLRICDTMYQLLAAEEEFLEAGYEGLIIRDPYGLHKDGRSTVKEGGLLRIKRFIDAEALITGIVEGEANGNEAQINERGLQFRSSHQENKTPNGLVGSILGTLLDDVFDPVRKDVKLLSRGQQITISPGNIDHTMRAHYFKHQDQLVGHIAKFKFFPKGIKDKPRFPVFQSLRSPEDM